MTSPPHRYNANLSLFIGDTEHLWYWQKLTNTFSKKYGDNWQAGKDANAALGSLVKERLKRHADGEELDDLFEPLAGNTKGEDTGISFKDQVAEVEQAGKPLAIVAHDQCTLIANSGSWD